MSFTMLTVSGLILTGLLLWLGPRILNREKPVDEFADEFRTDIIDRVRWEQRKSSSIWRASFTEKAIPYTLAMIAFYSMFVALDATFAYFKGGWWIGIVFFMVLFITIDSLQVIAVTSTDQGAGHALFKSRHAFVWVLVVAGFVLNVYLSQVGYGLFHNIVSTKTDNEAALAHGVISDAKNKRRELNRLEKMRARGEIRPAAQVSEELQGLLLREPHPQSECRLENRAKYGRWSKANCPRVSELRQELVHAKRLITLRQTVPQLERQTGTMGPVATDNDPTAGHIVSMLGAFGWTVDKLTVGEVIIRVVLIILSGLFPVVLFLWSDKAHEEKERIEFETREKTDRVLARHAMRQGDDNRIAPAKGLAPVEKLQLVAPEPQKQIEHHFLSSTPQNQKIVNRIVQVFDDMPDGLYSGDQVYQRYIAAGGTLPRSSFNTYLPAALSQRENISMDEQFNVTVAA